MSSIKAAPVAPLPLPADIFPTLGAEAKVLQDRFRTFIQGMSIHAYVESLLKAYFKSTSQCQGQINVFVEPLHDLYKLRDSYAEILAKSNEVEGSSARHHKLAQAGVPIKKVIEWVEDI